MRKYVIHIGPSKTGSKYLQSLLFHSRSRLLAEGIDYPKLWWTAPNQIMHEPLEILLKNKLDSEIKQSFKTLNESDSRIIVLSCEGFVSVKEESLLLLREAIGDNPVEIVFYCRRWSDRIPSDWKQEIKMGKFPTLPEFYLDNIRNPTSLAAINYSLIWDKYSKVFGRKSLRLVSYSNIRDRGLDIFQHFVKTFLHSDFKPAVGEGLIQRNISLDMFDTEILRILNWHDYQEAKRFRLNMRVKFTMLRSRWDTESLRRVMEDEVGTLTIGDGEEPFRNSWSAISKYKDRLVDDGLGEECFRFRKELLQYVRSDYLAKEACATELRQLYQSISTTPLSHPDLT